MNNIEKLTRIAYRGVQPRALWLSHWFNSFKHANRSPTQILLPVGNVSALNFLLRDQELLQTLG